jgi:hypothetical protein
VVAGASGTLLATTEGSNFDTVLAVYRGASLPGLTPLACNDDNGASLTSSVAVSVTGGQTYYVQLGGFRNASGSYRLAVSLAGPAAHVGVAVNELEAPDASAERNRKR